MSKDSSEAPFLSYGVFENLGVEKYYSCDLPLSTFFVYSNSANFVVPSDEDRTSSQ